MLRQDHSSACGDHREAHLRDWRHWAAQSPPIPTATPAPRVLQFGNLSYPSLSYPSLCYPSLYVALRRGVAAALQIGFQITLSHSLDARVIMTGAPAAGRGFVFQCPVLLWAMVSLANIEQGYELLAIPGDAETNCVRNTRAGKAVALPGITEIAELRKVIIVRSEALM